MFRWVKIGYKLVGRVRVCPKCGEQFGADLK
jgi:hypothetical protein